LRLCGAGCADCAHEERQKADPDEKRADSAIARQMQTLLPVQMRPPAGAIPTSHTHEERLGGPAFAAKVSSVERATVHYRGMPAVPPEGRVPATCSVRASAWRCKLTSVRRGSAKSLACAVLVVHLSAGMYWPTPLAAPVEQDRLATSGADTGRCRAHAGQVLPLPAAHASQDARSMPHSAPHPQGQLPKHDCCGSGGCQCQCTQVISSDLSDPPRVIVAIQRVVPSVDARLPTARVDESLRPPIA
jgi:hypothetical protein